MILYLFFILFFLFVFLSFFINLEFYINDVNLKYTDYTLCKQEYDNIVSTREKVLNQREQKQEREEREKSLADSSVEVQWKDTIFQRESLLKEENKKQKESEKLVTQHEKEKSSCDAQLDSMQFKIGDARDKCRASSKELNELTDELKKIVKEYSSKFLPSINSLYNIKNQLNSEYLSLKNQNDNDVIVIESLMRKVQ